MSKKIVKAGILIVLLVVPALVFIFLKTFGENKFDLPYFFPEVNSNGTVKVVDGDTLFHQIPDFTLNTSNGEDFSLNKKASELKVVSFFFTRCGTTCPITNKYLSRIVDNFKGDSRIKIISITVDPEHDTEEVLAEYAKSLSNSLTNWYFLTGDKKTIYDLAIKEFKLPVSDASSYDSLITNIDETFIHSDKLILLDEKNFVRGIYSGTNNEETDRLKLEIKVLLDGINKREKR